MVYFSTCTLACWYPKCQPPMVSLSGHLDPSVQASRSSFTAPSPSAWHISTWPSPYPWPPLWPRSLRWKNKPKHCSGCFVVREKHCSTLAHQHSQVTCCTYTHIMVSLRSPKLTKADHLLTITHHNSTHKGTYQPYVRNLHVNFYMWSTYLYVFQVLKNWATRYSISEIHTKAQREKTMNEIKN